MSLPVCVCGTYKHPEIHGGRVYYICYNDRCMNYGGY